jgi:AcrR family transcriptional regulator
MARKDLLEAALVEARARGFADRSLREFAAALGTSHRMLVYHFGSRSGLLAAMVEEIEANQRTASQRVHTTVGEPIQAFRQMWKDLSHPKRAPDIRLFFELASMALQEQPGTQDWHRSFVEPWLGVADTGRNDARSRQLRRLDVAVVRGLLLDLLTTGNRKAVDASLDAYLLMRSGSRP